MTQFFRVMGRITGRALKSQALDHIVTDALKYAAAEVRLADLQLKRIFLRKKHKHHLNILGRTVYRLIRNDINPSSDERIASISQVLGEIDGEIDAVENLLRAKREQERDRRKQEQSRKKQNRSAGKSKSP